MKLESLIWLFSVLPTLTFGLRCFPNKGMVRIGTSNGRFYSSHVGTMRKNNLYMVFGGIAEKLGSIVELVAGQGKITEANIEDTLRVIRFMYTSCIYFLILDVTWI